MCSEAVISVGNHPSIGLPIPSEYLVRTSDLRSKASSPLDRKLPTEGFNLFPGRACSDLLHEQFIDVKKILVGDGNRFDEPPVFHEVGHFTAQFLSKLRENLNIRSVNFWHMLPSQLFQIRTNILFLQDARNSVTLSTRSSDMIKSAEAI